MCQFFTQTRLQILQIARLSGTEVTVSNCISGNVNASAVPYDRNGTILFQVDAKDQVWQYSEQGLLFPFTQRQHAG
jgi:hypothetical protein